MAQVWLQVLGCHAPCCPRRLHPALFFTPPPCPLPKPHTSGSSSGKRGKSRLEFLVEEAWKGSGVPVYRMIPPCLSPGFRYRDFGACGRLIFALWESQGSKAKGWPEIRLFSLEKESLLFQGLAQRGLMVHDEPQGADDAFCKNSFTTGISRGRQSRAPRLRRRQLFLPGSWAQGCPGPDGEGPSRTRRLRAPRDGCRSDTRCGPGPWQGAPRSRAGQIAEGQGQIGGARPGGRGTRLPGDGGEPSAGNNGQGQRQHTMGPCVGLPRLQAAVLAQNWLNSCTKDPTHET